MKIPRDDMIFPMSSTSSTFALIRLATPKGVSLCGNKGNNQNLGVLLPCMTVLSKLLIFESTRSNQQWFLYSLRLLHVLLHGEASLCLLTKTWPFQTSKNRISAQLRSLLFWKESMSVFIRPMNWRCWQVMISKNFLQFANLDLTVIRCSWYIHHYLVSSYRQL